MSQRRCALTGFEWSIIQPLLPNTPRGVPRVDDRRVLNGIYWRLGTGSRCRRCSRIERFFSKLKHCKAIATRSGTHDANVAALALALALVKLAATRNRLRGYKAVT